VEMQLNHFFKKSKVVFLKGLKGAYKNEKFESQKVVREYVKEAIEVARTKSHLYGTLFSKELNSFLRVRTIEDFKSRLSEIRDKELKRFIEQYILKYIR
ncbi:hypothetical protein HY502_01105, partial [Candidatus Woesebacteria bacterium]|nr:hypothetical protein [Candidatus Woesebacteria bacterium]